MIIRFSFKNYRSFRDLQEFSMLAENDKHNLEPTFEFVLANGTKLRLLKTAIIYGANGSGKSNFVRALYTLRNMILFRTNRNLVDVIGASITEYDPFKFDASSDKEPTEFQLEFICNAVRYRYQLSFDRQEIISESLDHYPKGQPANLFSRSNRHPEGFQSDVLHLAKLGESLQDKSGVNKLVGRNQTYLSTFSIAAHNQLTPVFRYFISLEIWNASEQNNIAILAKALTKELSLPENEHLKKRIGKLLKIADTKVEGISIREAGENEFKFPDLFPEHLRLEIIEENKTRVFARHLVYEDGKETSVSEQDMNEESAGTKVIYALGGLILKKMLTGGVVIFDELDNSLHPQLVRFLIKMFIHPVSNQQNAQLICATHEVMLLDKSLFRKDQIWITDKNKYGISEMTRISDFEGVREETSLEKWYLAGKFGGQPKIREIEFMFDNV
jgi:hypothetical protein